jgi:hypothetical protein
MKRYVFSFSDSLGWPPKTDLLMSTQQLWEGLDDLDPSTLPDL